MWSWYIRLHLPAFEFVGGADQLLDGIHPLMHGPALPIPVFVGLHFVKAGVFADRLVHARLAARPDWLLLLLFRITLTRRWNWAPAMKADPGD